MPSGFSSVTNTTTFRDAIRTYAPPWLSNYTGSRVLFTLGLQLDAFAEYLRIGCLQGFPTYCEEEALGYLGQDRKILRGPAEPSTSYRPRLKRYKSTWKKAGYPPVLLDQIASYYLPTQVTVRYIASGLDDTGASVTEWWTIQAGTVSYVRSTPGYWDWDGEIGDFRFWIVIYNDLLSTWNWDDLGRYWDEPGLTWGYLNGGQIYDIRNIIETFKCAGSHLGGLCLVPATLGFDPWYPGAPPGYPMPDGSWTNPENRFTGAQYFFVPGD